VAAMTFLFLILQLSGIYLSNTVNYIKDQLIYFIILKTLYFLQEIIGKGRSI